MRTYELMFIVHPEVEGDEFTAVVERITGLIERGSGTVKEVKPWGLRRLAYPIRDQWEGQYVLVYFEMDPQSVAEFERSILLVEPVMRHLVIRTE